MELQLIRWECVQASDAEDALPAAGNPVGQAAQVAFDDGPCVACCLEHGPDHVSENGVRLARREEFCVLDDEAQWSYSRGYLGARDCYICTWVVFAMKSTA